MFQNGQKVVVVSSGDPTRVIKVQSASGTPDPTRYPVVDTTGVTGRDQQVQIVSGGDPTRFPILRGVSDARATADSVISALTPAAWYRNATGVTSAGGFASQWDDYSGNTRNLVQATGTNQPAYSAGVFTLDGVDNYLKTSAFTLNQPETIYLVVNQVSWTGGERLCDGLANSTILQGLGAGGGVSPSIGMTAGGVGANVLTDLQVGSYGVVCALFNGASSALQVNANTPSTGNAGATNMGGFVLGSYYSFDFYFSNIAVKECVIFPDAHDATTRSSVITSLMSLFSIT